MLGDTAVAVNPKDKRYEDLIGKEINLPLSNRKIPIIADEIVDVEFGTGAVKVTPAHDPNDYEIGQKHNLNQITVVGFNGKMTKDAGDFEGLYIKQARAKVVEELKSLGLLEKEQSVRLGADFDFLKFEYIEYINQNTPAHIIDEKKTYKRADFNNAKLKVEDIDVCMHHNLVLITKADGACNIDYIAPSIDTEEEFDLHVKRVEYNRLYRESKFAQYQGEYEKVKLLQKKMKPIEYKMKRLDKIIHTQTLHPIIQSSEVNKKAEPKNQNSVSNESNSTNTEPSQQSL